MRDSLWAVLRAWWHSRRAHDAVASGSALLRSPLVTAAAEDLPKINRCPGKASPCGAFVQHPGELCFRCDPAVLTRERQEREARRPRTIAAAFRNASLAPTTRRLASDPLVR